MKKSKKAVVVALVAAIMSSAMIGCTSETEETSASSQAVSDSSAVSSAQSSDPVQTADEDFLVAMKNALQARYVKNFL